MFLKKFLIFHSNKTCAAGCRLSRASRPHMSRGNLREHPGDHRCQDLLQAVRSHLHLHRVPGSGRPVAGRPGPASLRSQRGGGQMDLWQVPLLHLAVCGRVDLHLLHPPPRHHQHGQIHRSHPPRHLPQHHDWQEVKLSQYHYKYIRGKSTKIKAF